jgi:DNA sulfur modification protein DndB
MMRIVSTSRCASHRILRTRGPLAAAQLLLDFWSAVALVLADAWDQPRRHLVSKGVGVYALTAIAVDIYSEARNPAACDKKYFAAALADLVFELDWTNEGDFRGLGGEAGVKSAIDLLRNAKKSRRVRTLRSG